MPIPMIMKMKIIITGISPSFTSVCSGMIGALRACIEYSIKMTSSSMYRIEMKMRIGQLLLKDNNSVCFSACSYLILLRKNTHKSNTTMR